MIVVLAGGVGAARFLAGLVQVRPPADITAIVNTGDDVEIHGLHVSPDLDTVIYTLAGAVNTETGWGLADDTWQAMTTLAELGGETWFRLGDRDLGTHLYRTERLREGADLMTVTREITTARGIDVVVLPATNDPVPTMVTVAGDSGGPSEIGFQDYFVRLRHAVPVTAVRFDGIDDAKPAPGVLDAIADAEVVVIAPSNPIVSIGPVLAVPGVRAAVSDRRDAVVAVSPIVAGAALKGPADRLLRELGHEASVVGVARLYRDVAGALVVDEADAALAATVESEGVRCVTAAAVMHTTPDAAALAATVLAAAGAVGS